MHQDRAQIMHYSKDTITAHQYQIPDKPFLTRSYIRVFSSMMTDTPGGLACSGQRARDMAIPKMMAYAQVPSLTNTRIIDPRWRGPMARVEKNLTSVSANSMVSNAKEIALRYSS